MLIKHLGLVQMEKLGKFTKFDYLIRSQTPYLLACSIVAQGKITLKMHVKENNVDV
jgi:hypothetical protein